MTSADDIEERERERQRYLVAFYELTIDEPLRWSTHRQIAQAAHISEERIMTVSQHLANGGLVQLRTMGGIDGSVELTTLGIHEAEQAIKRADDGPPTATNSQTGSSPEADEAWAKAHIPMLELAFDGFRRDGSWPELDSLQRALDKSGQGIDVRDALTSIPRLAGDTWLPYPTNFFLPLRMLRYLPDAQPALDACLSLVQRAVDLYYSETEVLQISSEDSWTDLQSQRSELKLAARLLLNDSPSPFAGGGYGPDDAWSLSVNGTMARRFQDIASMDTYFARQRQLRNESQEQFAAHVGRAHPSSTPLGAEGGAAGARGQSRTGSHNDPTIFVIMPFGESWSVGVYDFIKRAIRSLGYPKDCVVRADEITAPGKIDQQIMQAIAVADVVIADISGANPNVMWELGYAQASLIPAVVMNQHFGQSPFDLASTRQVSYRLAPTDDDETKLADHIRSAVGEGQAQRASAEGSERR